MKVILINDAKFHQVSQQAMTVSQYARRANPGTSPKWISLVSFISNCTPAM